MATLLTFSRSVAPPTVDAWRWKRRGEPPRLIIWCQHCRSYHQHGAPPKPEGLAGHRVAHCKIRSPWSVTGYVLNEVGMLPAHIERDMLGLCRGPDEA